MNRSIKILAALAMLAYLSACGRVHTAVDKPATATFVGIKQVGVADVQVKSKETNPDALVLNEQWRSLAATEIGKALAVKGINTAAATQGTVECKIDVTYGNRALRYFVGFGAGAGHMLVTVSLKDPAGATLYTTTSKADLAIGAFGGNMSAVAQKTIKTAVTDFVSHL